MTFSLGVALFVFGFTGSLAAWFYVLSLWWPKLGELGED